MFQNIKILIILFILNVISLKASIVESEIENYLYEPSRVTHEIIFYYDCLPEIEQGIIDGINSNDPVLLRDLLEQNELLDANFVIDSDDMRPIHLAIDKDPSILRILLEHKADPNLRTKKDGYTPLHLLAMKANLEKKHKSEVARILLSYNADFKLKCKKTKMTKRSGGHGAIGASQLARIFGNWAVEHVLRTNAIAPANSKKRQNQEDDDLLSQCIDTETTETIIDESVDTDLTNKAKKRKVSIEHESGSQEIIEHELSSNCQASSNSGSSSSNSSAQQRLIRALIANNIPEVLQVFEDNPDLHPDFNMDDDNTRPIHLAVYKDLEIIRVLLKHNADPNAQTKRFGYTPLHLVALAPIATNKAAKEIIKNILTVFLFDPRTDTSIKSNHIDKHNKAANASNLAKKLSNWFVHNSIKQLSIDLRKK